MMNKINSKFIQNNQDFLVKCCVNNTKRLFCESKLFIATKNYSRAHLLIILAFEEIAKASLLQQGKNNKELTDHSKKATEIVNLICKFSNKKISKQKIQKWTKRIPQMREDCMYTRLKKTTNKENEPSDRYWEKRALSFYQYLNNVLKNF